MSRTLGQFLDACAARAPEREAISYAPRDKVTERLTWRELRERSRRAAKRLVAAGVGKGTRVGFLCSNRTEWLPIAFGALRIGAILVPFSTLWKRDEIAYGLRHGDVQVLLALPRFLKHDYVERLFEIVPELANAPSGTLLSSSAPALRRVVLLDRPNDALERWDGLAADVDDAVLDAVEQAVFPTDLATIFFTSGTTAQAKAVLHCHGALTTAAVGVGERLGIGPDDAWWGHMPLFWSGGFVLGALATMAGGGRIVLQEAVDAGSALQLLEAERCTVMAGWHQAGPLLEHPDFAKHKLHLRKGTYHELAERLLGPSHQAIGVYGMSETATFVSAAHSTDPQPIRCATFGRPLDGVEIRIVDTESGLPLKAGETGEILVKGPTLMEGYYKVPRATTFDGEGFFRTGDRGFFDEQGYLHFGGRLKDVIKTAGVNVAAAEIEETLAHHPAVKTAHVVGVPDPVRGENVAALVVLHSGRSATADELRSFCRERLASYKVPRHVFAIGDQDVPRTGTGKVEKPALREMAQRLVGDPGSSSAF
jgi:fatty-acyl-CoA synthase